MNLLLAPTYQPDAHEVLVDFRSTADDLVTVTVADQIVAILYSQTTDSLGTKANHPLDQITISSDYVQPEQNFFFRFRNPKRRLNLLIGVSATYGSSTYTKTVAVGEGISSHDQMQLPSNENWEVDLAAIPMPQGELDQPLTPVDIVLPPEIQQLIKRYDFTEGAPTIEFDPLTYTGGGNRLLLSNRTNAYFFQPGGQSPWSMSGYLFMDPAITNLIPNAFFTTATVAGPNGFHVDPSGALLTQTVAVDGQLASGAAVWTLRFRQGNHFTPFNTAKVSLTTAVPVTAGTTYCFSQYVQFKTLTQFTVPQNLSIGIEWYQGSTLLSTSKDTSATSGFSALTLASIVAQAPVGADHAKPIVLLNALDPGADVTLALFAPQLEAGTFPTSRTQGSRLTDSIGIPNYNATNQKFRLEFIPGFASGQDGVDREIFSGPLTATLTATQQIQVDISGQATVAASLVFQAGDLVDVSIEHRAGDLVKIYVAGALVASASLPTFSASPAPLVSNGTGMEITALTVFSRA